MNEAAKERIRQALNDAFDLDEGEEQIARFEDAVRLTDLEGNLELQYFAREELVRACIFGGANEKALVAFSWCLAQFDRNPGEFSEWAILWKYKWIIGTVIHFPEVSKSRIYELMDDLAIRSQRAGYGLRAAYNQRYRVEQFWDDREKASEYFEKMDAQPKDSLSNCSACELDDRVSFAIYRGQHEAGLELALPLIDGEHKCSSVPHRTLARLLLPLVQLGRWKEAFEYHQQGYQLVAGQGKFLDKVANHLIFLVLLGNLKQGLEVFEKHYPTMEKTRDSFLRFHFAVAACLLFEMIEEQPEDLHEAGHSLKLSLPRSSPLYSKDGRYHENDLAAWFRQEAAGIARRFDKRNQTDFFVRTLAETAALKRLKTSELV